MKAEPLYLFKLSKANKIVLSSIIPMPMLGVLILMAYCCIVGKYAYVVMGLLALVGLGLVLMKILYSSMEVYKDYCVVKTELHPIAGVRIPWSDVEEIFFRHSSFSGNQRIVLFYHTLTEQKSQKLVVLCDESDYIEDVIPLLDSHTRVRKY